MHDSLFSSRTLKKAIYKTFSPTNSPAVYYCSLHVHVCLKIVLRGLREGEGMCM